MTSEAYRYMKTKEMLVIITFLTIGHYVQQRDLII